MAEFFIGEVRIFSFSFAPKFWAKCNGQLLSISSNQALFSLLGTQYGGNGTTTFALPDLQSRVPIGYASSVDPGHQPPSIQIGQRAGQEAVTILASNLPTHNHSVFASTNGPTAPSPANNLWASNTGFVPYGITADTEMATESVGNTGGSQAHENRSPYLVLNFCMALSGIFPSRN
jgi:microcystin-dependent protein